MASCQRWPVVANGGQWWSMVAPLVPHVCMPGAFLAITIPCARCNTFHTYEPSNCQWQVATVATVANVVNVADLADVVCVATVANANARKCQRHRNYHHFVNE